MEKEKSKLRKTKMILLQKEPRTKKHFVILRLFMSAFKFSALWCSYEFLRSIMAIQSWHNSHIWIPYRSKHEIWKQCEYLFFSKRLFFYFCPNLFGFCFHFDQSGELKCGYYIFVAFITDDNGLKYLIYWLTKSTYHKWKHDSIETGLVWNLINLVHSLTSFFGYFE